MENGDLKRYYKVNNQDAKDFVRLNEEGKIPPELIDGGGTTVVANPTGEATADLTKLQVEDTIYAIDIGTDVVANPTLVGTEDNLTGLQVGDTKYKVEANITPNEYNAQTYTPSTTGYQDFLDDLTNHRDIILKISSIKYAMKYIYNSASNQYIYGTANTDYSNTTMRLQTARIGIENENIVVSTINPEFKVVSANPGSANTNLTSLQVGSTNYKLDYLPLSGGAMTGNIDVSVDNFYIRRTNGGSSNGNIISKSGQTTILGSDSNINNNVMIVKGANGKAYTAVNSSPSTILKYEILDESNTSANPGNTTATLTSLKLNNVNYAIAGGTQVTFVDWS